MKKQSNEELNILSKYELNFKQAANGYIRGIYTKDLEVLIPIANKYKITLSNKSCGSCVLGFMKSLGKVYDKLKETKKTKQTNG